MDGQCARHPEREAILTCERCGAFACPECVDDATSLCAACVEAGYAGRTVPWEAVTGGGFWATMRDAWLSPRELFGLLPSGDPNRAFSFAFLSACLYMLPAIASVGFMSTSLPGGRDLGATFAGALCGAPCGAGIGVLLGCTVLGGILFVAGTIAGAKASFGDVFRLVSYAQAYLVILGPAYVLVAVHPMVGGLAMLIAFPVLLGMQVNAFQAYFQRQQRLSPVVAGLVALAPAALFFGLCGMMFVVGFARGLSEAMAGR